MGPKHHFGKLCKYTSLLTTATYSKAVHLWSSLLGSPCPCFQRHSQNSGIPVTWKVYMWFHNGLGIPRNSYSKPALVARTSWPVYRLLTGCVWRHLRLSTRILKSNCNYFYLRGEQKIDSGLPCGYVSYLVDVQLLTVLESTNLTVCAS